MVAREICYCGRYLGGTKCEGNRPWLGALGGGGTRARAMSKPVTSILYPSISVRGEVT